MFIFRISLARDRTCPPVPLVNLGRNHQVAAGRTFKDRPSFVAKPDRIVFKDFVVGKVRLAKEAVTPAGGGETGGTI